MTDVAFYHLTRTTAETELPKLLARTRAAGERALVLCAAARIAVLDRVLWEAEWLPHGTEADGDAPLQPIWLAETGPAPNGARYLFRLDGADADPAEFTRVFDLFDEADRAAARTRYAAARTAGHTVSYWQQAAKGWEKKA